MVNKTLKYVDSLIKEKEKDLVKLNELKQLLIDYKSVIVPRAYIDYYNHMLIIRNNENMTIKDNIDAMDAVAFINDYYSLANKVNIYLDTTDIELSSKLKQNNKYTITFVRRTQ